VLGDIVAYGKSKDAHEIPRYIHAIQNGYEETLQFDLRDQIMGYLSGPTGLFGVLGGTPLKHVHFGDSGPGVSSLPEDIFRGIHSLKHINLGCYGMKTLPAGLFEGLTNLEKLDLHCSGLTSLPEGLLGGLSGLKSVHMTFCGKLPALPDGLFAGLSRLERVDMGKNASLSSLPEGLFRGSSSLKIVDMERNKKLMELPDAIFDGCTALVKVNLKETGITTLPASLSSLATANKELVVVR
jgi:Leucine-rich repeat (LRR) protein